MGSCLVILLVMIALSISQSMEKTLNNSGSKNNVIFLGAGSEESVERSEISSGTEEIIGANLSDIKRVMNRSAISPEVHFNGMVKFGDDHQEQALLRGIQPQAFWVHNQVRLIEGNYPSSGQIIVGRLAYRKLGLTKQDLIVGSSIFFNGEKLEIVGVFDARGTVMEAEIWMPLQDLMTLTQRDTLSCVVLSGNSREFFNEAEVFAKTRLDLELVALRESDYYQNLAYFYSPIRWMAWISAILISIGAFMGGLNTMYAAFSTRIKEFGALQAIGFSRISIFLSLFQEALMIGILAAITSILFGIFFIQDLSFPFAVGVFSLDFNNTVIMAGLVSGIMLGTFGVLPPSWKSLHPSLTETLRYS